ncbi:DUF6036 family nucleotidyltransferase [Burkholderiaceae bacterium UC74_6]
MTREQLEHIIRACAQITGEYEFVIVGSQSVLGAKPNPRPEFTASMEADIYPLNAPDKSHDIDVHIGEGSPFQEEFGYYAQGVDPSTAILPADWLSRVHRVQNENTDGRVGYCLDLVDLFLSKAWAGRPKDRDFCMAMLLHAFVTAPQVLELVATMPLSSQEMARLRATIRRWTADSIGRA